MSILLLNCESKGKNHHVLFLVDEIGQYIADDSQLMVNLQTVTEEMEMRECLFIMEVICLSSGQRLLSAIERWTLEEDFIQLQIMNRQRNGREKF